MPADPRVIVVTGARGFLGARVVPLLRRRFRGARLIVVVRGRRRLPFPAAGVERVEGDLRSAAVWGRLPPTVTHVVHLAAYIPWDRRQAHEPDVVLENVTPIAHLLRTSLEWPRLRRVVYGSSVSVYGSGPLPFRESSPAQPATPYGAAKLAGERLLDVLVSRGILVASLRFSSLYGMGQYPGTVLPLMVDRARRGLPLDVFNPARVQDFLHVDDAARATVLACAGQAGGAFNIGSGRAVSMARLARAILVAFEGRGGARIVAPGPGATPDAGMRIDIGRARRELEFDPGVPLAEGLARLAREGGVVGS
jgi:dTDP-glucose 4,6-dehydratase